MGQCCSREDSRGTKGFPFGDESSEEDEDLSSSTGYAGGPLTLDDLSARITAPKKSESIKIGNYTINYAYLSQRGYYPESMNKANQDAFISIPQFGLDSNKALFGVFDGHGATGDLCARFAAETLPKMIESELQETPSDDIMSVLKKAHDKTNEEMHAADFDDTMSGTTAISILFNGDEIYVSNVGDSRAVVAQEKQVEKRTASEVKLTETTLVAKPLSIDQTPFRKDERDRVKKTGARVLTVDQLEGIEEMHENWGLSLGEEIDESGDPPRIWHPIGDYPGTAFTRSFGDQISEELGVIPEPEVLSKVLNAHDRFIVLASQAVVNMIKEFEDPLDACRAVVEEAYSRWLQYEVRTDDITMICLYLSGISNKSVKDPAVTSGRNSIISGADIVALEDMQRPVRLAHNPKRNHAILGTDGIRFSFNHKDMDKFGEEEADYVVSEHKIPKSKKDEAQIRDIVAGNFIFSNLLDAQLTDIISVMKKVETSAGDFIIRQHEPGSTFFLVWSGEYDVRIISPEASKKNQNDDPPEPQTSLNPQDYGTVIHTYRASRNVFPSFGDLALIYSKPRAATIVARTGGHLWSLDRLAFRSILMKRPMRDTIETLRSVPVLKSLTFSQLQRLAEELIEVSYYQGTTVVQEGDIGDAFYLIVQGSARVMVKDKQVGELTTHEYFGEASLLTHEPRNASVIAETKLRCLTIKRAAFETTLGRLSTIVEHDFRKRHMRSALVRARKEARFPDAFTLFGGKLKSDSETGENSETGEILKNDSKKGEDADIRLSELNVHLILRDSLTSSLRLVSFPENPTELWTLRSANKLACVESRIQNQLVGEQDVYCSITSYHDMEHTPEKDNNHIHHHPTSSELAIVTPLHSMCITESDIHMLYKDRAMVDDFESFLGSTKRSEGFAQYYVAEVLLGLECLHREGLICRTIDPLELMVDAQGHLNIINLRLAKYVGTGRTFTICGHRSYLSPEIVQGHGHDVMSDYWSLGVLCYQMVSGQELFPTEDDASSRGDRNELELFEKISNFEPSSVQFDKSVPVATQALIRGLLHPQRQQRLGYQNARYLHEQKQNLDMRAHPFFFKFKWQDLSDGKLSPPLESEAGIRLKEMLLEAPGERRFEHGPSYTHSNQDWLKNF